VVLDYDEISTPAGSPIVMPITGRGVRSGLSGVVRAIR